MLDDRGDLKGAEAAYEHADQLGSADAAIDLGLVLERRGEIVGALGAYRRAEGVGIQTPLSISATCT